MARASLLFARAGEPSTRAAWSSHFVMHSVSSQTDAELLRRIAEPGMAAQDEMEEFYRRHVRYLYSVVRKQCSMLGFSDAETEDVVHDAFQRAFTHAGSFRASETPEPDGQRRWTRAWLGRIARNLILSALRAQREWPASDALEQQEAPGPPSSGRPNPRLSALETALETLSERERDVLCVSALYHRAGVRQQRLPNEASQELARRWNTSNENVRAIRMRALKKVAVLTERLLKEAAKP